MPLLEAAASFDGTRVSRQDRRCTDVCRPSIATIPVRPRTVRIRDVVPEDAERLVALRQALFRETDFMLYGPGEYSRTPAEVASHIQQSSRRATNRLLVAEGDGTFAGFLSVEGSLVPRLRHCGHLALGVLRSWWGRGVATGLITEALRWAPTAGISRLELSVMTTNERAIALYERLGFRFEGLRRRAYMVNGAAVDDRIMGYVFDA